MVTGPKRPLSAVGHYVNGGAAGSVAPSDTPPPGAQIVSSFGSLADAAEKNQLVEKFTFNFRYAPWTQVLQDFAASTGYTLDVKRQPAHSVISTATNTTSIRRWTL